MTDTDRADTFRATFDADPEFRTRAPGRVNLIGEHTDYNDGFCLPMAIERSVTVLGRIRNDETIRATSLQENGTVSWSTTQTPDKDPATPWADYLKACSEVLRGEGVALRGCDLLIDGDVPLGSGLSSSAALEVATIHALLAAADVTLDSVAIAKLGQRAENEFVGTQCGILDQLSSSCAADGHAMLMDCRSLALTHAPLPQGVSVVIADTGKRRGLVDSAYNERRAQCEAGAAALGVSHLRDVDLHGLWQAREEGAIDAQTFDRCSHVIAENGRTLAAFAALRAGDPVSFGQLMDQSHADLRDRFVVTCPELDRMVTIARSLPGCLGSRMTGAGFGGCTVSLVEHGRVPAFVQDLETAYRSHFDLPVSVYVTGAAAGGGIVR